MSAVISLDEFRKNLSDIVARVMYGNQIVRVQKHSRAGVVVISEKEYESLKDPRKRFSSKEDWDRLFLLADQVRGRMSIQDQEDLNRVVSEEVQSARTQENEQDD